MSKRKKLVLMSFMIAIISMLSLSGCSLFGPKTAADVFIKSQEAMKDTGNNLHADINAGFEIMVELTENDETMTLSIPLDIKANTDVFEKYTHTNAKMSYALAMGTGEENSFNMSDEAEIEGYTVSSDKEIAMYSKEEIDEDVFWYFERGEVPTFTEYDEETIRSIFEDIECQKIENGYRVEVPITYLLNNETLMNNVNDIIKENTEEENSYELDPTVIENILGNCKLTWTFDKDYNLTGINMPKTTLNSDVLISEIEKTMPSDGEESVDLLEILGINLNKLEISFLFNVKFSQFGEMTEEKVRVPAEVVEAAVEKKDADDSSWLDEDFNANFGEDDEIIDPDLVTSTIHPSSISSNWEDLNIRIDGVIYDLPCNYALFKDNGWEYDLTAFDYENNELDIDSHMFECFDLTNKKYWDESGDFYIWTSFFNPTDSMLDISKCVVDSVTLGNNFDKYPSLELTGGITWGDSMEKIISVYGEPAEEYPQPEYGWTEMCYESSDNTSFMYLTVSEEKGLVDVYLSYYY